MLIAPKWLKVRTSNLARLFPGKVPTWPLKHFSENGAWRDPLIFWGLNANSSKVTKGTNFKFGTLAPRESPDMTPKKFFRKGAWPGLRDPLNFWALNANSSKTTKDTYFKFGVRAPRDSPDMTPENFFRKGGVVRVTWPLKFLGVKC